MNQTLAKFSLTAIFAVIAGIFGWAGWLVLMVIVCAGVDWVTGTIAAFRKGLWSSHLAREGIFGKLGMFLAVAASAIFDLLIYLISTNLPMVDLPFSYKTLLLPLVCIWYICTEFGSILE
ncbi:MAG: phage holin family protein, partial [Clostridia bacterium]|nr:phage holin family protein [Clostridia bacterium]